MIIEHRFYNKENIKAFIRAVKLNDELLNSWYGSSFNKSTIQTSSSSIVH